MKKLLWPSMEILHKESLAWFKTRGEVPYMPGTSLTYGRRKKNVPVILMGRYLEQMVSSSAWPFETIKLWVLSRTVKHSLVHLANIHPSHVGVIPRYQLFSAKELRPFPDLKKPWSLVYSGRMVEDKGFLLFLKIAHQFQKMGLPVTPVIFGVKNQKQSSENKKISALLKTLNWEIPPVIWLNLRQDEWIKKPVESPVLLNFTYYLKDDFGVSVAQAQSLGWPLLLSKWGGNLDVEGENVRFFDLKEITKLSLPKLCKLILKRVEDLNTHAPYEEAVSDPEPLTRHDLKKIRLSLKKLEVSSLEEWPKTVMKKNASFFSETPEFILDQEAIPWRVRNPERLQKLLRDFLNVAHALDGKKGRPQDVTQKLRSGWLKSQATYQETKERYRQKLYLEALEWLGNKSLSLKDLGVIHAKISGLKGRSSVRRKKVFLKDPLGRVVDQCPDPRALTLLINAGSDLLSFKNNLILDALWVHFFILVVHPFGDGNGRVARMLERSLMNAQGIRFRPDWNPEVIVHWDLPGYTKAIHEAKKCRHVDPFFEFILNCYITAGKGLLL